jgi:hypothetical protein
VSYRTSQNKHVESKDVVLFAAAARTATVNGSAVEAEQFGELYCELNVTAQSGTTPTLDVTIETSKDGTNWVQIGAFTQVTTSTGVSRRSFGGVSRFVRGRATIGGTTPSYTFDLTGELK